MDTNNAAQAPLHLTQPPHNKVKHFDLKGWETVVEKALSKYRKKIGEKPISYSKVAETVINKQQVNILEKIAFAVLVLSTVFTSFKTSAMAVPYSKLVLDHLSHGAEVHVFIVWAFTIVTMLFLSALATPAVIYFKLLDHTPRIQQQKKDTALNFRYKWTTGEGFLRNSMTCFNVFSLDWITPRLPAFFTYAAIVWLITIGFAGGGTIFEMWLPVIAEVGLAGLVATIIEKQAAYRSLVEEKRLPMITEWKRRNEQYMDDTDFHTIIYMEIRNGLVNLKDGKKGFPNAWLADADAAVIDKIILDEFRQFTGAQKFSENVKNLNYELQTEKSATNDITLVPPSGASQWTPDTLFRSLQMRSIQGEYSEAMLAKDYGGEYGARKAWRDGARQMYNEQQSA